MRNITIEESKKIQLELLTDIHSFCEDHDLTYFLMFGTLLGAIRHKGFIPWDDDIDICMPRKDYLFLQKEYNNSPVRPFSKAVFCETDESYYYPFGKLIDTRTVLKEDVNTSGSIGVYIDIFPLDYLSENVKSNVNTRRKLHFLRDVLSVSILPGSDRRKGIKRIVHSVLNKFSSLINMNYISKKMNVISMKLNNGENSSYMGIISNIDAKGINRTYEAAWFASKRLTEFECKHFYIPDKYDEILSYVYGDYMTPPPDDKRQSLHVYSQYWKE